MYCTMAGPSVRIVPSSSWSAGTYPLGLTAKKSLPSSAVFAARSTLTSVNGVFVSRRMMCGESEHAPGA
jgi:hypothetical protein